MVQQYDSYKNIYYKSFNGVQILCSNLSRIGLEELTKRHIMTN